MTDLNVKIANEAYVIYEALAEVADQQAHEQSLQTAIEHIVTYLQQLETEAQERQLAGLETVCQLTQFQLIHFDIQDNQQKQTLLNYIEQWPKIILDYLNNPEDLQMQAQLVHNLSQHAAADELPPLAELLAQDTQQLLATQEDNAFEALVADEAYPPFESAEATADEPTPDLDTSPSYPASMESTPVLSETEWDKILDETAFEALADEEQDVQAAEVTPEVESEPQTAAEVSPEKETGRETTDETPAEAEQEASTESSESSFVAETAEHSLAQEQEATLPAQQTTIPLESSTQFISGSRKQPADATELPSATQSINTLSNQIVELSDTLNQSLNQFVSLDEDSEVFLDALEHYTNALQSLWETAEKLGLKGFQEICTFINDNIFEASALPHSERLALRTLFELWPQLVLDYLHFPSENAPVLIEHLQQSTWLISLSEDKAKSLLVQLVQETVVPQIIEKAPGRHTPATPKTVEPPSATQSGEPAPAQPTAEDNFFKPEPSIPMNRPEWGEAFIEEDIHLAREADHEALWLTLEEDSAPAESTDSKPPLPKEDFEPSSAQIELAPAEILDLLIAEISEAQHDLTTALHHFMAADEDSAALLDAVEQYTDNVQSIWEAAGMANLSGLQTVCTFIKENMFELSTLARAVRRALGPHIEAWPNLVLAYLREPFSGAQTLVTYLSNPVWLLPLDDAQARALLAQLTLEDTATTTMVSVAEKSFEAVETDTVFKVQADEATASSESEALTVLNTQLSRLNEQLPPILDNLTQADAGSETLAIAIEAYTDAVQSLWDAAEVADLVGLQDICTFINDNVIQLSEHSQSARLTLREVLATWPQLVQIYSYNPLEGIPRLINLLKQPYWPAPLADSQIAVLENRLRIREHLPQEELETTIAESSTLEVDVSASTTSEVIEEIDVSESTPSEVIEEVAETVEIIEPDELPEPIADDTAARIEPQQEISEQSFEAIADTVEETPEQAPLNETAAILIDEDIEPPALDTLEDTQPLVATDTLDSIIDLLNHISTALTETLDLLCVADEETFFTAIETYTEYVQSLWDTGELAGLAGLQDMCLLMNDNIIQLAQLTPQQRQAIKPLFKIWPQWLLTYLQAPSATIHPLIHYLQEEHWPTPLVPGVRADDGKRIDGGGGVHGGAGEDEEGEQRDAVRETHR
ncbi:MAG: hypothetical protein SVR94_03575, partial [Pseudomonadota bacterium]|nr:hypothetical protein [Pseudomonadota bacterium]